MAGSAEYGFVDRLLHHLAFLHPGLQKALGELENDLYAKDLAGEEGKRPVFVTGLPRSGTTLLLEMLYGTGDFTTITYRQMPFVLAPLLWNKLSAPFQKAGEEKERAHGDGMTVSFDSPEAFEEVLWLAHLRDRIVSPDRLEPVKPSDLSDEFQDAFRDLTRKLAHLERTGRQSADMDAKSGALRYLSKNNANVSRLEAIRKVFPDATLLVPFRDPLAHIGSLDKQHKNFLEQHDSDAFAEKYMAWIGHYDFGRNFRPIDFTGQQPSPRDPGDVSMTFWLRYWVNCYTYALAHAGEGVHFVDYDGLLADGEGTLGRLAKILKLTDDQGLIKGAADLRPATSKATGAEEVDAELLTEARALHEKLKAAAV